MTITPRQMICPQSNWGNKCPYAMTAEAITVHNTANDASANNEIAYMNRNTNEVSFHFAIDDVEVVQGLPLNRNGWHAGDGGNGYGNRKTIGIEICYSKSGGDRFIAAEKLAAKFIAQLLYERGWGVDRVGTHQMRSGKYCPHRTLDMGWQRYVDMIQAELNALKTPPTPPKPKINWKDVTPTTREINGTTDLLDLSTGKIVKQLSGGFDYVQETTYNGEVYVRTQYSKDHGTDYGVRLSCFKPIETPKPEEPKPVPEPTPEPKPVSEPEPAKPDDDFVETPIEEPSEPDDGESEPAPEDYDHPTVISVVWAAIKQFIKDLFTRRNK